MDPKALNFSEYVYDLVEQFPSTGIYELVGQMKPAAYLNDPLSTKEAII